MNPFRKHTGLVAPLDRANVDTDQIIPKQFLKRIERTGFGEFLFYDWRASSSFVLNEPRYQGASILVAGKNFGCGSSREHAPWALGEFGFRAIIAPSFADIFANNCFKNGMLPIALTDDQVAEIMKRAQQEEGYQLTIDLERQTVEDSLGLSILFVVSEFQRYCLLEGLDDIGLTLRHEDAIRSFEERRAATEGRPYSRCDLLTKDYDDLFDEVVNTGKHLGTTFDRHCNDDHQREYKPGHEPNKRCVARQQLWIGVSEFNQSPDATFHSRQFITVSEKTGNRRRQYLVMTFRNHARNSHQRGREIQSYQRTLLRGVLVRRRLRCLAPGAIERSTARNNQERCAADAHHRAFEIVAGGEMPVFVCECSDEFFLTQRFEHVTRDKQPRAKGADDRDDRKRVLQYESRDSDRFEFNAS